MREDAQRGLRCSRSRLAKREAKRADEAKATRESYWATVAAIEAAAA
jgi:hypothetical protein